MTDRWIDRVSELADGGLSARERRAFEEHVRSCARCAAALEAVRDVVARGQALNRPMEPARDLWPGIASRLAPRTVRDRWSWLRGASWLRPQLAAAAVVLTGAVVLAVWLLHGRPFDLAGNRSVRTGQASQSASTPAGVPPESESEREYDAKVARLQREARDRLTLDPHVIEVLDENLATLDSAIATYREALSDEPGNQRLRDRLKSARERKLAVLQQAVSLAAEGSE